VDALASHFIVVTTFERCESESRKLMEKKVNANKVDISHLGKDVNWRFHKIRWLRLIVDEGHELGNSNLRAMH
jgi:SNF2-related domain